MSSQSGLNFWSYHPALYYGLAILLGTYANASFHPSILCIALILIYPFLLTKDFLKLILFLILFVSAMVYAHFSISHPDISPTGISGIASIKINSITKKDTFKGPQWHYEGKIINFLPFDEKLESFKNISFSIDIPDKDDINRPPADKDYKIEGRLKKLKNGRYVIAPNYKKSWISIGNSRSNAEWRFDLKNKLKNLILQKISIEPAASFLSGISTGFFENRLLSFEFSRFGLQHIMAISGFHFSLLTTMLGFFLSLFCNRKIVYVLLISLTTLYFIFLGATPSIIRAWVATCLALSAFLLHKFPSALNALGVALISTILLDPDYVFDIGFQFSFLITAAIIMGNKIIDVKLQSVITKRSLSEVIEMNTLNQTGFILISFIRKFISLSFAINLIALPLSLYYFERFPVLSLLYNFFFPLMVSFSLFFLISGFFLDSLFPLLGAQIHSLNALFTQFVIDYTYHLPQKIDLYIHLPLDLNYLLLIIVLLFVYCSYAIKKSDSISTII